MCPQRTELQTSRQATRREMCAAFLSRMRSQQREGLEQSIEPGRRARRTETGVRNFLIRHPISNRAVSLDPKVVMGWIFTSTRRSGRLTRWGA